MTIFRIDLYLTAIYEQLGVLWLVLAVGCLAYVIFADLVRSLSLTILLLVCSQVWPREPLRDLGMFASALRWTLFLILFVRGLVHVATTKPPPDEPVWARRLMIGLGGLTLLSAAWSDTSEFTVSLGISFCLGLVVTFGLVWRLADDPNFLSRIARGVVILAVPLFASGFILGGLGHALKRWDLVDNTKLTGVWGDRYNGVLSNANAIGLVGAVMLPVLLAAPREQLGRVATLRPLAVLLTAATIFLSGSRSALIGSVVAVVILATYRYRAGALVTVALVGVGTWGVLAFAPVDDIDATAFGHISRTKNIATLSGREDLWRTGWQAAQGHLVIGQGWGSSRNVGGEVDIERATEYGHVWGATNLHNAHLQLLIDVGFVGVGIFWAFCACVLAAGWSVLRAPRSPDSELCVVIFTSTLALLADTWVHGGIWSIGNPTTLAFWSLCVITLKQGHAAQRRIRLGDLAALEPPRVTLPAPA